MSTTTLVIFVGLTVALLLLSRNCLRDRRRHGFYRFFAFECILVLVLVNARHWFQDPFSPRQIVSWILLLSSGVLAVHGFWMLRVLGEPEGSIENTSRLVVQGAYKYVRHPLYSTLLLGAWGVVLKNVSPLSVVLALLVSGFAAATAKVEEVENLRRFGPDYANYMKKTRMLIPFLF